MSKIGGWASSGLHRRDSSNPRRIRRSWWRRDAVWSSSPARSRWMPAASWWRQAISPARPGRCTRTSARPSRAPAPNRRTSSSSPPTWSATRPSYGHWSLRRAPRSSVRGTAAALPLVIRLVWDASPTVTTGLFVVTVVAGLVPAISAYTSKLLVNAVVLGIEVHNHPATVADAVRFDFGPLHTPVFTAVNAIIFLAVLQLLIFALIAFLSTARNITQQLLQNAVSMRIQLMVMEKAASLDLAFYEDPASYDLLRRAQTDSINRPVLMISTAFGLVQTALTFVT